MERERPRLALLDLVLPDTDGIDQMRAVLNVADAPVIFISAYGREETIARTARWEPWTTWSSPSPPRGSIYMASQRLYPVQGEEDMGWYWPGDRAYRAR